MDDLISRSEAIRVASGYCHWSNIPDELAKLPSVNPIPCEDAISRQAVLDLIEHYNSDGLGSVFYGYEEGVKFADAVNKLPSVSTEKTGRWIPVERELPELNKPLLVTAYHRVCYAHMISKNGNYGYPVFRLHELKNSDRGWVQETISHEPYSKGRIDAWMYIDIPQPYKVESEG